MSSATSGTVLTRSYTYNEWGNLTGVTAGGTGNTLPSYTLIYANNGTGVPVTNRINTIPAQAMNRECRLSPVMRPE